MEEAEILAALERLFASRSAADIEAAFAAVPGLWRPEVAEHLAAEAAEAEGEPFRSVAEAKLAVWQKAVSGSFADAWAALESVAQQVIDEVLVPRSQALLADIEHNFATQNWAGLFQAGSELLRLAEAGGPPELRVQARRAIAGSSFHDTSETRAGSLETAIRCWEQILVIVDEHPDLDWADVRPVALTNLGTALGARVLGDPRANQERAIACQREALPLFSIETDGDGWAMAHTNLGLSLLQHAVELRAGETDPRDLGLPEEDVPPDILQASADVEEAIAHFHAALEWRSVERSPGDWAYTQTNLGLAYGRRREGDRRRNLETSISHYAAAERGFGAAGLDDLRAIALHDTASETLRLANLEDTAMEERERLLADALTAAREAAERRPIEAAPVEVGRAWSLVGAILAASTRRVEAMAAYREALRGLTPATAPRLCRDAARDLASLAADEDDWVGSADAWEVAAEAANVASVARATSRGRFDELDRSQNIHRWAAYAAARAGRPERAVELLESGRSRELARWVGADAEDLEQLRLQNEALADRYTALEHTIELIERDLRTGLPISEENAARTSEWLDATIREIREIEGFERFLEPPLFADVAATVRSNEALVYLLTAPAGSLALILFAGRSFRVVDARALTSMEAFTAFLAVDVEQEMVTGYYLGHHLGGEVLDAALATAGSLIAEPLLHPVSDALRDAGVTELCLIPVALLGLLPLHSLSWIEGDEERCLLDDFVVSVAPSAFVRNVCARRAEQREGSRRRLLIVVDPESREDPLLNAELEAEAIQTAFPSDDVVLLRGASATKKNVVTALHSSNFLHFACHGTGAALGSPLETGLLLAPDDLWVAAEILQERPIDPRLVVASACETGVIQGGTTATDEVISLSSVFLAAGAAACIATLWSINDYTTALLMTRFYEAFAAGATPAAALREAQLWLRDLTDEDEARYIGDREVLAQHKGRSQRSADFSAPRQQRPYASQVYWAPFVFSGA